MNLDKLRLLGSGFTEEEYRLYHFDRLPDIKAAMQYLSHRRNHQIYRPAVNRGAQQHTLEDKWVTQLFLSGLSIPVARTWGLYHPGFGATIDGAAFRTPEDVAAVLGPHLPLRLILKPRGGRKGRNILRADLHPAADGGIGVTVDGAELSLAAFLETLPDDAFGDYDGNYHGWLVQDCLRQHEFLDRINPHTINSMRVVTFIAADDTIGVHLAALRLGRAGGVADNWDRGGLSVAIDVGTGTLGQGLAKPRYGGAWTSVHPDTGERFEGRQLPEWPRVLEVCRRAAAAFSGIRAVGWDVALTPDGPVIIEGNATWGLPVVQVHTKGYLTPEVRAELARHGAYFPEEPPSVPRALLALLGYQWQRSRGPGLLQSIHARLRRPTSGG
ncbi:MAG: sugar-transfer associated ATP-grasp domain-containing protein [Gammaproteobacteria bacterium]|jgi:hypothetical protein|nr:sugar-transfer associated ATP-grasp domain-containing protein [Gammaproteobacteria bacterium]